MNLVIVESPTKAKTLKRFLSDDYAIEASMGHIRDLPKSKLGVDIKKDFKPSYVLAKGKGKVVKVLREAAKQAKIIYLAMDPDREGEAIAYHVRYILSRKPKTKNQKPFKRITFHQITKTAVKEAIAQAHGIDLKLVDAQQARRILDRLVGYKLSPILWKKVRRGLSAGRVQSVAVRLIVEREEEIETFKPVEYWDIKVQLAKQKEKFWAELMAIGGKKAKPGEFLITSEKQAKPVIAALKKATYSVKDVNREEKRRHPFPPFTTSTLQQAGANVFGWPAKKTMQQAQRLYERGRITYHRTDSVHLASSAINSARKLIDSEYGHQYLPEKPRVYKTTSKSAQEAHEAIHPTNIKLLPKDTKLEADQAKLYRLIWQRFIACQMADAVYDQTTITITAIAKKNYTLRATGSMMKFAGWRVLYKRQAEEVQLPQVTSGESLKFIKLTSDQKFTQPPPRYNDASLVKELERRGIGRPSTYAPTISTIIARGYVERLDRRFHPTTVGTTVTKFLLKNFNTVMDYEFTAAMEDDLDKIAVGKRDWIPVIREFWQPFHQKVKQVQDKAKRIKIPVEKTGRKCPQCGKDKGGEEVIRTGRFGKFLSCSRFPDCDYTATYTEYVKGVTCPDCGAKVVLRRSKKGKMFYGCSTYPKCNWASWKDPRKKSKLKKQVK